MGYFTFNFAPRFIEKCRQSGEYNIIYFAGFSILHTNTMNFTFFTFTSIQFCFLTSNEKHPLKSLYSHLGIYIDTLGLRWEVRNNMSGLPLWRHCGCPRSRATLIIFLLKYMFFSSVIQMRCRGNNAIIDYNLSINT